MHSLNDVFAWSFVSLFNYETCRFIWYTIGKRRCRIIDTAICLYRVFIPTSSLCLRKQCSIVFPISISLLLIWNTNFTKTRNTYITQNSRVAIIILMCASIVELSTHCMGGYRLLVFHLQLGYDIEQSRQWCLRNFVVVSLASESVPLQHYTPSNIELDWGIPLNNNHPDSGWNTLS